MQFRILWLPAHADINRCLVLQGTRISKPVPQTTDILNGVSNLDMRKFEPFLMEDVDQEGIAQ